MIPQSIGQTQKALGNRIRTIEYINNVMDNESLKNENETKKEECSIICAQKPNDKIKETTLK